MRQLVCWSKTSIRWSINIALIINSYVITVSKPDMSLCLTNCFILLVFFNPMNSSLIQLEQERCRVCIKIIISIFSPIGRCEATKCLLILLAFCNYQSRSFVFALFVELVYRKLIFRCPKYSFEFKGSIVEAFFEEVRVFLKVN